jgi:hypothetical protein
MTHLPPTTRLSPTTRLLLVHSPLVGPASWDLIAPALTEPGRDVTIPDLSSTIAAGPPWCSRQAELIARAAAGQPAVLVGHRGRPDPGRGRRPDPPGPRLRLR